MTPNSAFDKFRQHEIEQRLASDLHSAREQTRRASNEEQKQNVLETYLLALQRYTEFAAKGRVPEEFGSRVAHTNRMARGLSDR
jgi:hypothetical protein